MKKLLQHKHQNASSTPKKKVLQRVVAFILLLTLFLYLTGCVSDTPVPSTPENESSFIPQDTTLEAPTETPPTENEVPLLELYIIGIPGKDNIYNTLWGYADKNGAVVIEPQFDSVDTFDKYGIAIVRFNHVAGYIDQTGAWLVEPQFESASAFDDNGLARVRKDGRWGYINTTGAWIIGPDYHTTE